MKVRSCLMPIVASLAALLTLTAAEAQTGKCCLPDGRGCRNVTQAQCDLFGGVFLAGQSCAHPDDTCDPPLSGACCQAGTCTSLPQAQCPSGAPFFPNSPCAPTTCTPPSLGACCENFQCRATLSIDCSGSFTPGQACTPGFCGVPPQGACCQGGACTITLNSACIGPGREWYTGQSCTAQFCRLGACCTSPLSCVVVTFPGCEQGGWVADGSCAPLFCVAGFGACCRDSAACIVTTEADCADGAFFFNLPCDGCPGQGGACCQGTLCILALPSVCTGAFQGLGSSCGLPGNPTTCCPANFNGAGGVTVQDIFDFLAAYFAGDPRADFNNAGGVTVQDIFDFLAAYFTGC